VLSRGPAFGSVRLDARGRLDTPVEISNRDVILILGHSSDTEFGYVHLSTDNTIYPHNGIFVVSNKDGSIGVKVVIAGGSGALGQRIARDLIDRGDDAVVLTRSSRSAGWGRGVQWDGATVGDWATELAGAAVINLCGQLVDRRPTPANIDLLTRSRTEPTRALVNAAAALDQPVRVWLQMSTLAIYGEAGDRILDEAAAPADGPPQMAGVARAWEASAEAAQARRRVVLRTGVVLDRDTPAFDRLTGLVRWGLGGRLGTGRQWVSWLHIADMLAIVRRCLDDPGLDGIVHATSPQPVPNSELMATFRRSLNRPPSPPVPAPLVRLGALVMRTAPALALTGRRCVPSRLLRAGFEFKHPDLHDAVADLIRNG
jgi:uncharacterized protein